LSQFVWARRCADIPYRGGASCRTLKHRTTVTPMAPAERSWGTAGPKSEKCHRIRIVYDISRRSSRLAAAHIADLTNPETSPV
jgi:hypothetical protein